MGPFVVALVELAGGGYENRAAQPAVVLRNRASKLPAVVRISTHGRFGAGEAGAMIASFPVKHHWREPADLALIRRSAYQLVALADKFGYSRVVLPRTGAGNGRLVWRDVRPTLAEVLDNRFSVVSFPK